MQVKDKIALVTGGGVGAGRAIAFALAHEGCHVAVNYSRSEGQAMATAEGLRETGVRAMAVKGDVGDDAAVRSMVQQVADTLGGLNVLVNNAGATSFIPHGDLEAVQDEDWDRILDVNLKGPFYVIRAARPHLERDGGVVVNISSVAGVYGVGSSVPYLASKAGLNTMTIALARALGPAIRINSIAPGFIDTRWWQVREEYETVKQGATERSPLKNVCQPEDVADLVMGLIRADLITGQVVVLDGGSNLG